MQNVGLNRGSPLSLTIQSDKVAASPIALLNVRLADEMVKSACYARIRNDSNFECDLAIVEHEQAGYSDLVHAQLQS